MDLGFRMHAERTPNPNRLNLVAPTGDNEYYNLRGSIGVPRPGLSTPGEGLPLDPSNPAASPFSFHRYPFR